MKCVGAWIIDPHHIMENRRRNDMTEYEKFIYEADVYGIDTHVLFNGDLVEASNSYRSEPIL